MIKKMYIATLLLLTVIAPVSANYMGMKKQYCLADQVIFSGDRILIKEGDEVSEVSALFSDEEGLYFIRANKYVGDEDCRRNRGVPQNPYKNVCGKPNCPHGK